MSAAAISFAAPAEVELAENPINPDWIIEGNPRARAKRLAESADGTSSVMAWSCTPGRFEWHYAVDETVHIIAGEVLVTDQDGKIHRLGPGDMAFFPAGSHSAWQVTKTVRKLAVCRHSMPRPFGFALRAWNKNRPSADRFPDRQRAGGGAGAQCGRPEGRSGLARDRGRLPAAAGYSVSGIGRDWLRRVCLWRSLQSLTFRGGVPNQTASRQEFR
jgi:uncharacterized protein